MTIFEFTEEGITAIEGTTFSNEGIRERADLQRLLRERIEVILPDTMVIAEEFGDWDDSRRRIDLLALDKQANLVVIELKRTEDGGHMELQAIRYAAMVSAMTFDKVVVAHARYLKKLERKEDAKESILDFLEWEEANEDDFAQDVRVVLVSEDFSKEITTTVMWLNERMLDLRCIRLKPYNMEGRILVDVQQVIPLPEAEDYQVKLREKEQKKRSSRWQQKDLPTIADEKLRRGLMSKLNRISGVNIDETRLGGKPSFPVVCLANQEAMNLFKESFMWAIEEINTYK